MKTIKSLLAVSVLGFSTVLFAGNAYDFLEVIPLNMMDKAVVKVVFPKYQNTSIYVADPEGSIIHRETIKKGSSTAKIYNFSNLDDGIYTFYSITEQVNITKKIMVNNSSIEVISNEVEYKPVFIIKDNHLLVNYLNLEQEEIEMVIYNSNAELYRSTEGNSEVYQKKFHFSHHERGEYFAKITVGRKNYTHSFDIDKNNSHVINESLMSDTGTRVKK